MTKRKRQKVNRKVSVKPFVRNALGLKLKLVLGRRKYIANDKYADFQTDWSKHVPTLADCYIVQWDKVEFLSVMGDAPKDFVTDNEPNSDKRKRIKPRASYIAKVGSKWYPNESVVEEFLTRIGQCFDVVIAESKLRIIAGQVRFMSKFFLKPSEQLTHGAEILAQSIGKDDYDKLAEEKKESEYFSFQMICEAIKNAFPEYHQAIVGDLIEMLVFDALVGHNDRHPYNWGIIVPLSKTKPPRFAPVYDTARALFWNNPEKKIVQMLTNKAQFESYVSYCKLPFSWDGEEKVDFFRLIGLIWNSNESWRKRIENFLSYEKLEACLKILDNEFNNLMSNERRELIKRCLILRQELLSEAIKSFQ
jgi:HipA-like C-terminal domain